MTHKRDGILDNLQDAFEVPYWELIADFFLEARSNSLNEKSLSTEFTLSVEIILRVLDSLTTDLQDDLRRLKMNDKEDIPQPILDGIDARIKVLRTILDSASSEINGKEELLSPVFEKAQAEQPITEENLTILTPDEMGDNKTVRELYLDLSLLD